MCFKGNVFFGGDVVTTRPSSLGCLSCCGMLLGTCQESRGKSVDWSNDGVKFLWLINEQCSKPLLAGLYRGLHYQNSNIDTNNSHIFLSRCHLEPKGPSFFGYLAVSFRGLYLLPG